MGRQRISKIAVKLLPQFGGGDVVAYRDLDILHAIYEEAGFTSKNAHPLNQCARVLDAMDRESKQENALFEKYYFKAIRGNARAFQIKRSEYE